MIAAIANAMTPNHVECRTFLKPQHSRFLFRWAPSVAANGHVQKVRTDFRDGQSQPVEHFVFFPNSESNRVSGLKGTQTAHSEHGEGIITV